MLMNFFDFETTGIDPEQCEPCQIGLVEVEVREDGSFIETESICQYLKIDADEMPEGARKIHGISYDTCQTYGVDPHEIIGSIQGPVGGYNILKFDNFVAGRYGAKITEALDLFVPAARLKVAENLDSARLTAMFTRFVGGSIVDAHNALADVHMTLGIMRPLMEWSGKKTFEEFMTWCDPTIPRPELPMPFGKHKGKPMGNVPKSYRRWALENLQLWGDVRSAFEALEDLENLPPGSEV